MRIDELETPALLLDVDVLERNLRRMAAYCSAHGLSLRPHTKTHKTPEIARLQIRHGARGITVAKLSEAEIMADAGIDDILIVYPLWGERKWRRLAILAQRANIVVTMDSYEVAAGISAAAVAAGVEIGVRLEFDTGFRRCGLPIQPASVEIARRVQTLPSLRWEGISVYPGHIMGNASIREADLARENSILDRLFDMLDTAHIFYPIVSGGNTPAAFDSHLYRGITEIRPGTYVFNDRNTVDAEAAQYDQCALTVLATVVSRSVPGTAIIDTGSKTLSADTLLSGRRQGFGYIREYPEVRIHGLSEEHGHLDVTADVPLLGERVRIVPNHVCTCVNLHSHMYLTSGEDVIDQWTIAARGKVE